MCDQTEMSQRMGAIAGIVLLACLGSNPSYAINETSAPIDFSQESRPTVVVPPPESREAKMRAQSKADMEALQRSLVLTEANTVWRKAFHNEMSVKREDLNPDIFEDLTQNSHANHVDLRNHYDYFSRKNWLDSVDIGKVDDLTRVYITVDVISAPEDFRLSVRSSDHPLVNQFMSIEDELYVLGHESFSSDKEKKGRKSPLSKSKLTIEQKRTLNKQQKEIERARILWKRYDDVERQMKEIHEREFEQVKVKKGSRFRIVLNGKEASKKNLSKKLSELQKNDSLRVVRVDSINGNGIFTMRRLLDPIHHLSEDDYAKEKLKRNLKIRSWIKKSGSKVHAGRLWLPKRWVKPIAAGGLGAGIGIGGSLLGDFLQKNVEEAAESELSGSGPSVQTTQ